MRIVVLGPPGAGKSYQSTCLARAFGVPHLSTGDILRSAVQRGNSVGLRIGAAIESGGVVSDDLVKACVAARLSEPDSQQGFVLDGYPRTIDQAMQLEHQENGTSIDAAIELVVDFDLLVQRIIERSFQPAAAGKQLRAEDSQKTLHVRIANCVANTAPLTDFYRERGKLMQVDGMADIEAVTAKLVTMGTAVSRLPSRMQVLTRRRGRSLTGQILFASTLRVSTTPPLSRRCSCRLSNNRCSGGGPDCHS